jgi:hypothetical protein
MDHALAKQLAEAGFPQGGNGRWLFDPSSIVARSKDRVYSPTLEELIEGCGVKFHVLENFRHESGAYTWTAMGAGYTGSGMDPAEAVARLYLTLRAKSQEEKAHDEAACCLNARSQRS